MKHCYACNRYGTCTSLCATAEEFVSQDYVSQSQFPNAMVLPEADNRYWNNRYLTLNTIAEQRQASLNEFRCASIDWDLLPLPPNKKTVLQLFYIDGLKIKQIAERLCIHKGTVRRYMWTGRDILKRHLRNNATTPGISIDPSKFNLASL